MRDVVQVIKEDNKKLSPFVSALSQDWEVVLFKAIDMLHSIEKEGYCRTGNVKNRLLQMSVKSLYDDEEMNRAICEVKELYDEGDREIISCLDEILKYLYAVKITKKEKRRD